MSEEKSLSQRAFFDFTDIRKLQDKAKTSYTNSRERTSDMIVRSSFLCLRSATALKVSITEAKILLVQNDKNGKILFRKDDKDRNV